MSSSISISPSTPFLKASASRKHLPLHANPNRLSSFLLNKSQDLTPPPIYGIFASSYPRSSPLCSSSRFSSSSVPSLVFDHGNKKDFKIQAILVPESAGESENEKSTKLIQTLQLGSLFGLWYLFNIYFNIYNKQTLKVFPFPVTITTFQFVVGTAVVLTMWTLNLHKRPKITTAQFGAQEPGSNEEIVEFACTRFKAEYPIFDKVDVNGDNAAPIYKYLKSSKGSLFGDGIKWNFAKFLIDKEGHVVDRYAPTTSPLSIEKDIKKLLSASA